MQHRHPGVGQPIRGQVLGRPMILDRSDRRDFLHGTLSGKLHRLPLRHANGGRDVDLLLERDGGVYVECEAVSLTRDTPRGLGWLIEPVIRDLPRESLINTLRKTREALGKD